MEIIKGIEEMSHLAGSLKRDNKSIVFVPTMGYLHDGHLNLIREGKKRGDILIVSIYVNPIQFNEKSDFESYPNDLTRDIELLKGESCHILFLPTSDSMYPSGFQTALAIDDLSKGMCGDSRPGHFNGVATVVAKLFNIVKPDIAIFGEKDYQQLAIIRRMVSDLNFDVEIVGIPTVREEDGLAMSSRNVRLNAEERKWSLSLSKALFKGKEMYKAGTISAVLLIEIVKREIVDSIKVDYVEIRDAYSLLATKEIKKEAVLAIAARVGNTRLIDNIILKEEKIAENNVEI